MVAADWKRGRDWVNTSACGCYPPGGSGATCPSAARPSAPGGRGGNAAEDGARSRGEDLHPRPTVPGAPRRRPVFRRRSQSHAEASGAVRLHLSAQTLTALHSLGRLQKNKYGFPHVAETFEGYLQHYLL